MEYYVKLFELFVKAIGLKINKENYKEVYAKYKDDFFMWLDLYKISTYEYRNYLQQYFGIDLDDFYLAELDKGNIDSVVREDAFMLTPYGYTFTDIYHKSSNLILTPNEMKADFGTHTEDINDIRTFITQNPYLESKSISQLKRLYEFHNRNIILGMYGRLSDKDKNSKIRILKQFKKNIDPNNQVFDIDYNTKEDNYFCTMTKK